MRRRHTWVFLVLVALLAASALVMTGLWPFINRVETGETPEYPAIQPAYYRAAPADVLDAARETIDSRNRWSVVRVESGERTIEATHETLVLGFVDDVTVEVRPVTDAVARVDVVSESRLGEWDFGQNARNIRDFFEGLNSRIGDTRLDPQEVGSGGAGGSND
ncbi:MAG: DUF1499 domain-containing protein [Bradymonadaceae bacterium]